MKLTKTQRQILFALGEFYKQLNQPLQAKPLQLRTSKIVFITFLLHSQIITQQERALYKNLEILEREKLIAYQRRMIRLTEKGLQILVRIDQELGQFLALKHFFTEKKGIKKEFQTIIY